MTQLNLSFKAAEVGAKIEENLDKLDRLLNQSNNDELSAIGLKMSDRLKEYKAKGAINVAFVGQYNAGKSTMISALTGRRDIRIDSDIATDTTSTYDWNGIQIIDTPGLFTDRKDHDDITYEAIDKADLLVFSLTYMLFDSLTAKNFKYLAYEKGYRWKMMIVVNKMSNEAGEEEQKIANYRQSLANAISPNNLDEFPLCFVDAKDYCEGIDGADSFLTEISRFQTFIDALNNFAQRRASLTKFDTPIRITLRHLDDAQNIVLRDSVKDTAFFELLSRLTRIIQQERERLHIKVKSITLQLSAEVVNEGSILGDLLGTQKEEDFRLSIERSEYKIKCFSEEAGKDIEKVVDETINSTKSTVKDLLEGDLFEAFEARLSVNSNSSLASVPVNTEIETAKLHRQVDVIKNIATKAGVEIRNLAGVAGVSGFAKASQVAGSTAHQWVYQVGKLVGYKFAPWGAVNIAKNVANAMPFIGAALTMVSVAVEINASNEEKKQQEKFLDARLNVTSDFVRIAKDLESQVDGQIREFELQFFGDIEQQISEARQSEEAEIKNSNQYYSQLADLRKEFDIILIDISRSAGS
jgi:small GTP-binding protein